MKVVSAVGARPNFVKIAPIIEEMRTHPELTSHLVHTGQHYGRPMSESFFEDLHLPPPDAYLNVGSGRPGEQTGRIIAGFEKYLERTRPDLVIVVGDVNSTVACGLAAVKLQIRVAHVEAGLRSFDRGMPEEINRVLTDHISHLLFTTEESAGANLRREGIPQESIHFVGNVMVTTLLKNLDRAKNRPVLARLALRPREYVLVTLHRPENVDDRATLSGLIEALCRLSRVRPILFPIHPRSRQRLAASDLAGRVRTYPAVRIIDPLGYLDFLHCMANAALVITDSGGVQDESTALGVPCLTARDNTERPVTTTIGTNTLVGRRADRLLAEAVRVLDGHVRPSGMPPRWDDKVAVRIVDIVLETASHHGADDV
jgi:UDP-N-acetylglucosamine 2-epimerase (non-hydrolysing)